MKIECKDCSQTGTCESKNNVREAEGCILYNCNTCTLNDCSNCEKLTTKRS